MSECQLVYNCRQPECGTGVEIVKVETLLVSYFSVINISLRWLSSALAPGQRVTKPLEHLLTQNHRTDGIGRGSEKKEAIGEQEEALAVRRKKNHLKIISILEKRRRR